MGGQFYNGEGPNAKNINAKSSFRHKGNNAERPQGAPRVKVEPQGPAGLGNVKGAPKGIRLVRLG